MSKRGIRLPPEVNRILLVKNLPYKITSEEMFDIFGKYGPIRQIRIGSAAETKGTALVAYDDIYDAKNACDNLSGFNVCNRYLIVLYYQVNKVTKKVDAAKKREEIDALKKKHGV
uniref:RRM domain-containing protein n=1 Tax=Palpitomonas bilix TaxID=652834 RepID=A0A7S3G337_9EUKA|mmetsp:Transcript_15126/g.38219  ORF Transcript_15126/g.38219 Transcript_15126/m.38219 type:complete len:115 (+) Transcript_15126:213-557(+)|eukprot:CAMPEP_0113894122 /NCGR_PEP_ID=MMETSP0780_2-20120614/16513_1 /TAXON_ID=652834 /ORGANISM="Palpitomonas bilix" /LENGTH=114 /DNA_ID=CAMNT_0000884569 /DNA_START=187 /DNA_END=531 /DNA_ORIENTATION=- /assembly_acc=CAM_ASM_000599